MPLPLIPIAAGVAARYGAKKLAKYLVKRNTKKVNVKAKKLEQKNFQKDSANHPFGLSKPEKGMHPTYPKVKTLRGQKKVDPNRNRDSSDFTFKNNDPFTRAKKELSPLRTPYRKVKKK